jgi:acetate kinase
MSNPFRYFNSSPEVIRLVLMYTGVVAILDPERNARGALQINRDDSRVSVWVIPTDEEQMIARHTRALLG